MKTMKKALALLLCAVLLLGIAMPAAAADAPASPAATLLRQRSATKNVTFGSSYVYPYGTSFDAAVVKGESTLLRFKRDHASPGGNNDIFYVLIARGTSDDDIDENDIVEERTYNMSQFNNANTSLAITWKADSRYTTGDYCLVCAVFDEYGNMYDQIYYAIDLHVVSKKSEATEIVTYCVEDGYFYTGIPDIIDIYDVVCLMPCLYPFTSTTAPNFKLTVSEPSILSVESDCGYFYLTPKGYGYTDITITCGKLKFVAKNVIVGRPDSVKLTPGRTELCVGMTDTIQVKASPSRTAKPWWESSNPAVATVKNGVVTAVSPGKATIYVRLGTQQYQLSYTVCLHDLPDGTPYTKRTATMPYAQIGNCSRCGKTNVINVYEPAIFTDTQYNAWYAEHVDFVYDNGIMNGTGTRTFSPNGNMTRAMVATAIYRMEGEPAVTGSGSFTDVAKSQWFTNAINWAASLGIVTGYPDGTFRPNDLITREQFATILYRYTKMKNVEMKPGADLSAFPDSGKVQSYATDAMRWAIAEGLITGIASGSVTRLAPRDNATRAQFATIISRYMKAEWKPLPEPIEE